MRWKMINGERCIKARLTIRGFEDVEDTTTFASTATRWAQRMIASIAMLEGWDIWIADVATAFLQSDSFETMAQNEGTEVRHVCLLPPKGYEAEFQKLKGFQDIDFNVECLQLLRPAYGLKDAPRAWKMKLESELLKLDAKACPTDGSLYRFYDKQGKLLCVLATHVDDLKGCGHKPTVDKILQSLAHAFGPLKIASKVFEHCGLKHHQDASGITISQAHYAAQLRPIPTLGMNVAKIDTPLDKKETKAFQSILGGLSWLTQTRADVAIFVVALQRVATRATTGHVLKVNQLVRYCRKTPCHLYYPKLEGPLQILTISDAAFRRESTAGLSMRGSFISLAEDRVGLVGGRFHLIEFFARKQRRIVRSTFSAELNGVADSHEIARLISLSYASVKLPNASASDLQRLETEGNLPYSIHIVTDCFSIFTALSKETVTLPAEATLILLLLSLKECLRAWSLRKLSWVDTRDMLADGLGKGAVSRKAIVEACCQASWDLKYKAVSHLEKLRKPPRSLFALTVIAEEMLTEWRNQDSQLGL
jgi:hypothetical protein